jgi:uncharacterized protein Smg (DUF494 family)
MHERIVEIILFLVNELRSNKRLSEVDITLLTRDGYTQSEISSAFSWVFERISVGQVVSDLSVGTSTSQRILNDTEKMIIEPKAHGYLIQCQQLGLLNNADVEIILERILAAGFSKIRLDEIKSFVAGYLFDIDGSKNQVSLGINDTIH